MSSLVDSRPDPSIPLPQRAQTPPIKTTTNTFTNQLQPQPSPSTPLDIPGAFPHEAFRPAPRLAASETSRGQSYFPPKPASYLLGTKKTSLPSSEKEGVKPGEHYDGVGPLPGSISETSVAKLPDERSQSAREADQPTVKRAVEVGSASLPPQESKGVQPYEHHGGVGPLLGPPSETSATKLSDERFQPAREADQSTGKPAVEAGSTSLPSQETEGVQPYEHHGGVGPLLGPRSETSVAKLPEERAGATSEERSGAAAAATQEPRPVVPPGSWGPVPYPPVPDTANPETQVKSIDPQGPAAVQKNLERDDQGADVKEKVLADPKSRDKAGVKEEKKSDLERKDERKGETERAAEESTKSAKREEVTKATAPSAPSSPTQRKGRSGRASSDSDASHHKRASVMNMVKGEMKVLLGKASRNKGRVAEGEKLKHGSD